MGIDSMVAEVLTKTAPSTGSTRCRLVAVREQKLRPEIPRTRRWGLAICLKAGRTRQRAGLRLIRCSAHLGAVG